jgi:hypothetical protein
MRRSYALLLSFLLPLLAISWYLGDSRYQATPRLIIDASVDQDFAAVIQETWAQFLLVFAARRDCFGDVRVKADYDLADRAKYDPRTATISVRVPERASILKGALVHEWAHIFSSDWANIPSEQYAETTIVVVLGERPVSTNASITAEEVEVVRA